MIFAAIEEYKRNNEKEQWKQITKSACLIYCSCFQ